VLVTSARRAAHTLGRTPMSPALPGSADTVFLVDLDVGGTDA
jgi:hypothetical protein